MQIKNKGFLSQTTNSTINSERNSVLQLQLDLAVYEVQIKQSFEEILYKLQNQFKNILVKNKDQLSENFLHEGFPLKIIVGENLYSRVVLYILKKIRKSVIQEYSENEVKIYLKKQNAEFVVQKSGLENQFMFDFYQKILMFKLYVSLLAHLINTFLHLKKINQRIQLRI